MPRAMREDDPGDAASDPQRLAEVRASGLLDTPADPKFDRWTMFLRKTLGCDVALITLLDRDRQFFKSASGLGEPWAGRRETPLSHSFCQYVVSRGELVRVPDARSDPVFSGNRAIPDLGVIAYLGVPLRSDSGRLLGSISAIQREPREWTEEEVELLTDGAAAVETEIRLRTLQGRLQAVMTNLTDLITVFDAEGRILYVSPSLTRILGRRAEDRLGGNVADMVHPDDREDLVEARRRVLDGTGSTSSVTVRVFHADGGQRFMEARLTNLLENPAVGGILGVIRDVTDRVDTERRLDLFVAHAPVGMWIVDSDLRFVWAAGLALDNLGLDPERLLGTTVYELFGTDAADSPPIAAYHDALSGRDARFEVEWSDRWWEVRLAPLTDSGNGPEVMGVAVDITDRKAVATRLEEQTAHFQGLFEDAPEAIVLVDQEGRILQVNQEFERLFGYSPEEVVGRQINAVIVAPEQRQEAAEISRRIAAGERLEVETVRRRKDGSPVDVSILATTVLMGSGARRIYGIYRDIGERKELESRLLHAQRLEAVGQLAGGVAHDFNNILTAILGHVTVLLERYGDDRELVDELEEVRGAGERAARLTRQLLTFSRRDMAVPRPTDVSEVIGNASKLLKRVIPENIDLSFDLAVSLPAVYIDPGQLEQVVMNLVINARDAMVSGGRLDVRTAPAPSVTEGPGATRERSWILIEVADEGHGMAPEDAARMFEPFFTTKSAAHGTGLGLSTVYGIVNRAGGLIDVDTEPGVGTSIRVRLPPSESPAAEPRTTEPPALDGAASGQGRVVLVVDDDRAVRRVLRKILERAGYRVLEADSGQAALARLRNMDIQPDAVVSDLVMPGMGGDQLLRRLRAEHPEIATVLMTGYADPNIDYELEAEPLSKPFDAPTLLAVLATRLSGAAGR